MLRSHINRLIEDAQQFMQGFGHVLPPFAHWPPAQIQSQEAAQMRARGLGWDVTDYGLGRFDEVGLVLFTARNGRAQDLMAGRGMLYAEKIMISRQNQICPMHRHIMKAEDIINRGGGVLVVELFGSNLQGGIDRDNDLTVPSDGMARRMSPGGYLRLEPGQSVTLMPGVWHRFWAEAADCLIGEVSTVNDDRTDNVFETPMDRFCRIDEDVLPIHLLVSDYLS